MLFRVSQKSLRNPIILFKFSRGSPHFKDSTMQIKVCLSGFSEKVKGMISGELESLGLSQEKGLAKDVDYLVCKNVGTEKYKVSS